MCNQLLSQFPDLNQGLLQSLGLPATLSEERKTSKRQILGMVAQSCNLGRLPSVQGFSPLVVLNSQIYGDTTRFA